MDAVRLKRMFCTIAAEYQTVQTKDLRKCIPQPPAVFRDEVFPLFDLFYLWDLAVANLEHHPPPPPNHISILLQNMTTRMSLSCLSLLQK